MRELKQLEKEQKREKADKQLQKKESEEKQLMKDQIREEQSGRKGEKKKEIDGRRAKEESKTEKEKEKEVNVLSLVHKFTEIQLSDNDDSSESEEDTVCPKCGRMYSDSGGLWVCCDGCNQWFHLRCTNIKKRNIPDFYYCENCVDSI